MDDNQILIYQEGQGKSGVQVKLYKETIWLSQKQMSELFDKDTDTIGLHLKNIYAANELDKSSTTENYSVVQKEGNRNVKRPVTFYNLDAIISVGYRVNSIKGTLFRIWATKTLKEHLVRGYTVNQTRLAELKQSVKLIQSTVKTESIDTDQTKEIVQVLTDFALGLEILDGYDNQSLQIKETSKGANYQINYNEAIDAINQLREKYGGSPLFGNEKDESFKSSIATIDQIFAGQELYPSIEEKASHLLYFVVKNHSFSDGNKRIAAWLFVWYLNKNAYLYSTSGKLKVENNALDSLTLMIALSTPEEKDLMIRVIINSINKLNE